MKKSIVNKFFVTALLLSALPLSACSEVKHQLGLTRRNPDEFAVMRRAPLAIPPDLNQASLSPSALPAPQPGAPRPQETAPQADAEVALLGAPSTQAGRPALSPSEAALLSRTGADQANSNIRQIVDKEALEDTEDNRPVVKRILDIGDKETPATVVDAKAEAQRLKNNRQKGAPITRGETPNRDE